MRKRGPPAVGAPWASQRAEGGPAAPDGILADSPDRAGVSVSHSVFPQVDVAIVGGGASGALVATHLAGVGADGPRVALIEAGDRLALGAAYSTPRPEHLLNVVASGMSAFDARPDDFVDFLRAGPWAGEAPDAIRGRFAPRMLYGRYLQTILDGLPADAPLDRMHGEVDTVSPVADGGFRLTLTSGDAFHARTVVLAIGNASARLPIPGADALSSAQLREAWDYPRVAAIDPDADVCIVGAGLSMVDAVLTLRANAHRGRIVALSRNGLMPLPHVAAAAPASGAYAEAALEAVLAGGVRTRMRALRAWAAHEQAAGRPWQGVMAAVRPYVQAMWASLPVSEQRRFLRHAARQWDIHRHRIAPEVASMLEALRAGGGFALLAGRAKALRVDDRVRIDYLGRDGAPGRIEADVVINATGMEKRIVRTANPVLRSLLAQGLARPGPHDIGIDTRHDGAVRDREGCPVPGMWALGVLRVGSLWESVAMPELRGQAHQVATAVRRQLADGRA